MINKKLLELLAVQDSPTITQHVVSVEFCVLILL